MSNLTVTDRPPAPGFGGGVNSFQKLVFEELSNQELATDLITDEFRAALRNAMLERLVMFGSTEIFQAIATDLATVQNIDIAQATALLWPTCHAVYKSAANYQLADNLSPTAKVQDLDRGASNAESALSLEEAGCDV